MYAILDIETTGGQYNEEGITEIAIYKFDGHEIVDQFISLVNPEKPIQPFVVKLTGINNAMLRSAPKFYEVAKRIIEITKDCVIVAHNAQFDYRILQTEFRRLGYDFESENLCTVELSKKLLPEQPSHSLGKLVRALGIPMSDRHRASGDAMATVKLFKMLLAKDQTREIVKSFIKTEVKSGISTKLKDLLESVPSATGVYYIHRQDGTIIFIGKSKNIKKRINQHFTATSRTNKKIQLEAFAVTYEETGTELIALLKETQEININKPVYNRISKKSPFQWSLYTEKDTNGYLNLTLRKTDKRKKEILSYTTYLEGRNELFRLSATFKLCQKYTGLYETENECFQFKINECDGACIQKVTPQDYNARVMELIAAKKINSKTMVIIDKGRTIEERSAILIEEGIYKGYAFYNLNYQIHNIDILKNILVPMTSSSEITKTIQSYIRKKKVLKIVEY